MTSRSRVFRCAPHNLANLGCCVVLGIRAQMAISFGHLGCIVSDKLPNGKEGNSGHSQPGTISMPQRVKLKIPQPMSLAKFLEP